MNSYLNELYLVFIPASFEYLEEFENYLSEIIKSWVFNRCEDFFQEDASLTFKIQDLPSLPIKGKKQEILVEETSLENSTKSASLQMLDPLNPDTLETDFKFSFLIEKICESLRIIHIKTDTSDQIYFGVEDNELFEDTLFKTTFIMRCMDFGTPDMPAMSIFYPIFRELKQNIRGYYAKFKQDKEEKENVDTGEL